MGRTSDNICEVQAVSNEKNDGLIDGSIDEGLRDEGSVEENACCPVLPTPVDNDGSDEGRRDGLYEGTKDGDTVGGIVG